MQKDNELYNIDEIVTKYLGKDYLTIHLELSMEVVHLENNHRKILKHPRVSEYKLVKYMKYAKDFLFYLNTGGIPAGIGIAGLNHFLPIINDLVEKGQLKQEALSIFRIQ